MIPNRVFFAASFIYHYENGDIESFPKIESLRTISPNPNLDDVDEEDCFTGEDDYAELSEQLVLKIIDSKILNVSEEDEKNHEIIVWLTGTVNWTGNFEEFDFKLTDQVIDLS
jgi:hypothetical protein